MKAINFTCLKLNLEEKGTGSAKKSKNSFINIIGHGNKVSNKVSNSRFIALVSFYAPENTRKHLVKKSIDIVWKGTSFMKWVKYIFNE